jgi:hypothetical protein
MDNYTWRCTDLRVIDLPAKAQQMIAAMNIDTSGLKIMLLNADPQGGFFKHFEGDKKDAVYSKPDSTIYFLEQIKVGTAIHEVTHFYLDNTEHDTKAIGEEFVRLYGRQALSSYAGVSIMDGDWEEVVCEIVAKYGRRGQFGKIKALFNCE